jgi:hypothetical protein
VKLSRELNAPGVGQLSVSLMHPNLASLTYRNVVRVYDDGNLIKSFVIREVEDVTVGPPEEQKRTVKGLGLLSRLQEMVRVTPNPIDELPLSYVRRHDWGAPETLTTSWVNVLYPQNRTTLLGTATNRPVAWPTPVAPNEALGVKWVHTRLEGVAHPAGVDYYHRSFTLDEDAEVAFFCSAADQFSACLDGVEMLTEELSGPNSVWWWTWKFAAALKAGTHSVRLRVELINSTGAGGVIFAAFKTGPGGINEILFVSGNNPDPTAVDGGWRVLRDPATPPGQTAGRIIRLGMEEAAARGVEVPTLNFSDTVDSNGDAWDATIPLAYRVPATEWDILESLTPWVEFSMSDVGYVLNVVNLSTGLGSATSVELDPVTFLKMAGAA